MSDFLPLSYHKSRRSSIPFFLVVAEIQAIYGTNLAESGWRKDNNWRNWKNAENKKKMKRFSKIWRVVALLFCCYNEGVPQNREQKGRVWFTTVPDDA